MKIASSSFALQSLFGVGAYSDLGACEKYFSLPGRLFEHERLFESWALNR